MIKKIKVKTTNKYSIRVTPPDTFSAFLEQNKVQSIDVHFGSNYDVVVIVPSDKELSKDNKERIRILTEVRQ